MPQISEREFEWLPLRPHQFLAGVPLQGLAQHVFTDQARKGKPGESLAFSGAGKAIDQKGAELFGLWASLNNRS